MAKEHYLDHREGFISDALLSINIGDVLVIGHAKPNTVRCMASQLGSRWGRRFTVHDLGDNQMAVKRLEVA